MVHNNHKLEDLLSYRVPRETSDIDGFCHGYQLRRHLYEQEANKGSLHLREDWSQYIGPVERWGCCNPYDGHFASIVLPLCKPERLGLASYIFEYAFLYDGVLESSSNAVLDENTDLPVLDDSQYHARQSAIGARQIQSKMINELLSIDKPCAEVVIKSWKEMAALTASRDKTCIFSDIMEYVDYRIIDTGAPFVDTVMRFGIGIVLTEEEEQLVGPIARPCYAALGLVNDFHSFDVEWELAQEEVNGTENLAMTNAVWLYMTWESLPITEAKKKVRQLARQFEREFQSWLDYMFADEQRCSPKVAAYLRALAFQIPGNAVWSLRTPRYHPELCEEAGALLQQSTSKKERALSLLLGQFLVKTALVIIVLFSFSSIYQ